MSNSLPTTFRLPPSADTVQPIAVGRASGPTRGSESPPPGRRRRRRLGRASVLVGLGVAASLAGLVNVQSPAHADGSAVPSDGTVELHGRDASGADVALPGPSYNLLDPVQKSLDEPPPGQPTFCDKQHDQVASALNSSGLPLTSWASCEHGPLSLTINDGIDLQITFPGHVEFGTKVTFEGVTIPTVIDAWYDVTVQTTLKANDSIDGAVSDTDPALTDGPLHIDDATLTVSHAHLESAVNPLGLANDILHENEAKINTTVTETASTPNPKLLPGLQSSIGDANRKLHAGAHAYADLLRPATPGGNDRFEFSEQVVRSSDGSEGYVTFTFARNAAPPTVPTCVPRQYGSASVQAGPCDATNPLQLLAANADSSPNQPPSSGWTVVDPGGRSYVDFDNHSDADYTGWFKVCTTNKYGVACGTPVLLTLTGAGPVDAGGLDGANGGTYGGPSRCTHGPNAHCTPIQFT